MNHTERKEIERCRDLAETIWQSDGDWDVSSEIADLKDTLARILAVPSRNCDIGTAREQAERREAWCNENDCPYGVLCQECLAAWLQMPYESEVKK